MILLSHNRLFLVICLPLRFQNRSCPAMCSCSFIIPYPYFDVNEIQHVFLAVFVVFIGCALLILFVFCIFMFFSIDFAFLLCHTWIYIEIPLFFKKIYAKRTFAFRSVICSQTVKEVYFYVSF